MPKVIILELVSGYCNSRCAWCFLSYDTGKQVDKGIIQKQDVVRFVELNSCGDYSIIPFSHGESLMHPDFNEIIELLIGNKFTIHSLHTNFAMDISDRHIENIAKINFVTVNVGGGTIQTHRFNMKTDLDVVLYNLSRLNRVKQSGVVVKSVINTHNKGEVAVLKNKIDKIVSQIRVET